MYNLTDYDEMVELMRGREWSSWIKFLRARVDSLTKKVLSEVRGGEIVEAQKTVAVIDDIMKQVELFRNTRKELEKEMSSNKEE